MKKNKKILFSLMLFYSNVVWGRTSTDTLTYFNYIFTWNMVKEACINSIQKCEEPVYKEVLDSFMMPTLQKDTLVFRYQYFKKKILINLNRCVGIEVITPAEYFTHLEIIEKRKRSQYVKLTKNKEILSNGKRVKILVYDENRIFIKEEILNIGEKKPLYSLSSMPNKKYGYSFIRIELF
jgi:hypothetical protein